MDTLLNPISWSAYLEILTVLAIAYYAFIGWKYYRHEIKALLARISGRKEDDRSLPAALQYTVEAEPSTRHQHDPEPGGTVHDEPPTGARKKLRESLTACISLAGNELYAPEALIPKLRKILHGYPDIAATPERGEINALIVRECEKTGTALLSESDVDLWWSA
jgi:hypothetical protein